MTPRPLVSGVEAAVPVSERRHLSLWALGRVFFTIGLTGFGGGMAIVALIRQVCVERLRWLTDEEFSHGIALGQFLGAFAVNTATFVGYRVRGLRGAVVAVVAFLAPGVVLISALAALYFRFQHLPLLQDALRGIAPVVVAVLLAAAYGMARTSVHSPEALLICLAAFVGLAWLSWPVIAMVAAVAAYALGQHWITRRRVVR